MVDTSQAIESEFLSVEEVKTNPVKDLLIIDEGKFEETQFGNRLCLKVNYAGKVKTWRPNRDTIRNLQELGKDSKDWVGKIISLRIIRARDKDMIIGYPKR